MVKQTNILLVNPACLDERVFGEDGSVVPIGLYYIGALLLENDFQTKIINLADKKKDAINIFKTIIKKEHPDVIGFSVTNPNRWNAMECAKAAKNINPDICVVFGGPAPTFLAEHLLNTCPEIDFIVTGEGELTFLDLVIAIEDQKKTNSFEKINGLVYNKKDAVFRTPLRRPVEDLDTLVHPSKYFTYQHLAMSRGCPGNCTFCGSPKFWGNNILRFHSPQWLFNEIYTLAKKGVSHFFISDDTFTMDRQRVIELCNLIIDKKLTITWNAISRVDYIDDDLLFSMRKAGCIQISFGVESGSKKIQKTLGKLIPHEKIISAFKKTASYGILPRAYFIYGSPGETDHTIQESIALLKKINPLSIIFYMLVVFPGTHLYQSAKNKGMVSDDLWHQKIEDLPWFKIDDTLDFKTVKIWGDRLRTQFYSHLDDFAKQLDLVDIKELYPYHADFLSRLALTFSHGEYADDKRVTNQNKTAQHLFEKALDYSPDARAFLGLAMLLQKQKQFDKAIQMLENGLDYFKNNKDLNICMGINLMNTGQFKTALNFFKKFSHFPETDHYINICNQQCAGTSI
ncbi:MAG: radical SAM protein [Desulfobacteraceae bacterium]|nr:radical SAM protein [Desulfobacteraceae bacterium]